MRLFTLCSYLKTKESYDRWVTRRVWGFRHQISKAKYLKKSVENIRKLQENFRCTVQKWRLGRQYYQSLLFDYGRKWIRRIVSVWRAKLSGESELLAADALRVSVIRGSGHV